MMSREIILTLMGDHQWTFFRAGGLDQVLFAQADDFRHLGQLDQKLWVALSCPVAGTEMPEETLALIDSDKDGRVRAPELLAAVQWACEALRDPADLMRGATELPVDAITPETELGRILGASARRILENLGKGAQGSIAPAEVADTVRIFAGTRYNGDGVVPPAAFDDPDVRAVAEAIVATLGGMPDRSGGTGFDAARVEAFYGALADYAAWWAEGEAASAPGSGVLPLGAATPAAHAALEKVRAKVDDYFNRCRLAAFDARAAGPLNRPESEYAALATRDLAQVGAEVAALPLAMIAAGKPLPLAEGVNPAWAGPLADLRKLVLEPLLGGPRTTLTEAQWTDVRERFGAYAAWATGKKGLAAEALGIARVREILARAESDRPVLAAALAADLAVAPEAEAIANVRRLALYYRDLYRLLNNFVSFTDFYDPRRWAAFQAGTLYLDSRSCNLCIQVADPGAHAALASLSQIYLAYCKCTRPGGAVMHIAACFTQGDSDYLRVGRNGVFYDRRGRDWDATIVKIVEAPISVRQAFWSPYKKFVRTIEEQIEKRAAAADSAASAKLTDTATAVAQTGAAGAAPPAAPKKMDVGTVAAIGVALGSLGTFAAMIFSQFVSLGWWIPVAIVGLMLAISFPSMLIAWLKLRRRTLGPVLDACGWAVNGRVAINIPFGTTLTAAAALPAGAKRSLEDPYEDKEGPRRTRLLLILVALLAGVAALLWWRYGG